MLISVIVPVYKVEAYLDKCISSIVNQTYQNLEIILVDDGSPDRSGDICDDWVKQDTRIRVIHQENKGGGAARNAALDAARGELIAFVDSDDYLADTMFEHLFRLLENGADIAECSYVDVYDEGEIFPLTPHKIMEYTTVEAMRLHIQDHVFRQLIWNKLYRREVIGSIRFPEGKKIDDEFFMYQVLGNARKLIHSDKVCYAYRQQESSVMHSMSPEKRLQAVEAKVLRHKYVEMNFPELAHESIKNLWLTCIYQGQLVLREMGRENRCEVFAYLQNVLKQHPLRTLEKELRQNIWCVMAGISLKGVCYIRNILKIGL